ncbi:MAG: 1-deoxy-D-xylulose-5-phosphate synthase N-terminal domain-containing protein [Acutalibacteraceae bacterium]
MTINVHFRNVGSMSRYLYKHPYRTVLFAGKRKCGKSSGPFVVIGVPYRVVKSKKIVKQMLYNTIFEDMGFAYYGPFDGHDVENLIHVLKMQNVCISLYCCIRTIFKKEKDRGPRKNARIRSTVFLSSMWQ